MGNRIESLLFTQGYRDVPKRAGALKAWLAERPGLGPQLRERLEREAERLELVESQLQRVETAMAQKIKSAPGHDLAVAARGLMSLCGLGLIGAWVLAAELFGWREFRNRRAWAILVELAWLWLRYQPGSALTQWFQARFAGGGKRLRRISIVALARRLAIALWRYLTQGVVPTGAVLKAAPG